MDFLPSSSSPSIFDKTLVLTQSEISAFHTIDRTLYSRLVIDLRRDSILSMKITALWIWLDRSRCHAGRLIVRINNLVDWSLQALADEAMACLICLSNEDFLETCNLQLTKTVLGRDAISLRIFHSNRVQIGDAIHKIVCDVCLKAFGDIIHRSIQIQAFPNPKNGGLGFVQNARSFAPYCNRVLNSGVDREVDREFLNCELRDVLEHMQFESYRNGGDHEEEDDDIPADERTIFLTFSKGYPISENEVAQFFTRKYGDIYESIHLQEKAIGGQPLYARLVLRSPSDIPVVLGKKIKAKFSINGKHVWARKYVRRNGPNSPTPTQSGSSPPQDPLSIAPAPRIL